MTSVSNRFSLLVVDDGRKKKAPSKPASAPSQPAASNVKKPEAKQSNEPKPQQQQKSSVPKQDTGKKQPQQKDTGAPKGDQPKGPRSDLPPRRGERREHKESEQPRQPRQPREPREPREGEQPREPRQPRQQREPRDGEQPREFRPRQPREPREPRDGEQPRERKPRPPRTEGSSEVAGGDSGNLSQSVEPAHQGSGPRNNKTRGPRPPRDPSKREFDRRGGPVAREKKGGHGKGNWGKPEEAEAEKTETVPESGNAEEKKEEEKVEDKKEEKVEAEEEDNTMTLEEYRKKMSQSKVEAPKQTRQVDNSQFKGAEVIQKADEVFFVGKKEVKETKKKETSKPTVERVDINPIPLIDSRQPPARQGRDKRGPNNNTQRSSNQKKTPPPQLNESEFPSLRS